MEKLNVAIADDNERMLNLLGEIVESDKDLKLVGKARNGEDIYHIIRDKQPDVVLLDLIMPKMDGISVMEMIGADKTVKKTAEFYYCNCDWTGENHGRCLRKRSSLLHPETISQ